MGKPKVGIVFLMPRHSLKNARQAAKQMGFAPVGNGWNTDTYKNICLFNITRKTVEVTPCHIVRELENRGRGSWYVFNFDGALFSYQKRSRPKSQTVEHIISSIVAGCLENNQ